MRVVAILGLLLLTLPGQAQRGMRAAPMARPAPGFRGATAPRFAPTPRGPVVRFAPHAPVAVRRFGGSGFAFGHIGRRGPRFRTFPFCDPTFVSCQFQLSRFGRRGFFSPFGFGAYGYGGYPLYWDTFSSDYSQPAAQPAPQPIVIYTQPPQERPAPQPAPRAQAAPATQPEPIALPPTVLVFRDQHREEVTNYAIAGDTLFAFLSTGRKKIPLSDLDLPATMKVNDDRGVEFRVPSHKGG